MGLSDQSFVGCFPEFVLQLSAGACGVAKAISKKKNPLGPVLLVSIIIIIIPEII